MTPSLGVENGSRVSRLFFFTGLTRPEVLTRTQIPPIFRKGLSNSVQIRSLWNIGDFNFLLFSDLVEFVNQFPIWGFSTWLNPFVLTDLHEVVNVENIVVVHRNGFGQTRLVACLQLGVGITPFGLERRRGLRINDPEGFPCIRDLLRGWGFGP